MRKLITALSVIFFFLLQTQWQILFPVFSSTPNLILILAVFTGFLAGSNYGIVSGFFGGLLIDTYMGQTLGFHSLIFLLLGYAGGCVREYFYDRDILCPLILVGTGDFIYNFIYYVFYFLLNGYLDLTYYLKTVMLPELAVTLFVGVIFYYLFYLIHRKLIKPERRDDEFDQIHI